MPALRSGGYAVLRALATLDEDTSAGMTKSQITDLAQQWCDSSLTATSGPGQYYTAWDSHKTLLDRNLIYSYGRPTKKYALTPEGWEIARKFSETSDSTTNEPVDELPASRDNQMVRENNNAHERSSRNGNKKIIQPNLASEQEDTRASKNVADMTIEELQAEIKRRTEEGGRKEAATQAPTNVPKSIPAIDIRSVASSPAQSPPRRRPLDEIKGAPSQPRLELSEMDPKAPLDKLSPSSHPPPLEPTRNLPTFDPLIIPPGEYTIHLIIDQREIRSRTDRTYIEDELAKQDVIPIVRSLEIGDALWVAKTNRASHLAELGEPFTTNSTSNPLNRALSSHDEIVLDYIIERKRFDDLEGSIKDGRFQEQKFRLKRCGIPNITYLVEEFGMGREENPRSLEMIETAIASTQIVDGFFVKQTHKLDDTIRYLVRTTKMLQRLYEGKPLYVIPSKVLEQATYLPLLKHLRNTEPEKKHNITFTAFASLASKSDTLSLRDVFLKMLMCTRGVTGPKATEIQKWWKTPVEFVEAYEMCRTAGKQGGRDMVLGVMGGMVGNRKMGSRLSAKIGEVWGDCGQV